jgi:hypothetical protein
MILLADPWHAGIDNFAADAWTTGNFKAAAVLRMV